MISVTGTTGKYILQPTLLDKHTKTLEWLSASALWKSEMAFFQKILDDRARLIQEIEEKKKVDHFQSLITYYNGEVIDLLRKKLREHESRLAHMLESENETDIQYYKEHEGVMDEAQTFAHTFANFRSEVMSFMPTK